VVDEPVDHRGGGYLVAEDLAHRPNGLLPVLLMSGYPGMPGECRLASQQPPAARGLVDVRSLCPGVSCERLGL
jgi:hypothetical protein